MSGAPKACHELARATKKNKPILVAPFTVCLSAASIKQHALTAVAEKAAADRQTGRQQGKQAGWLAALWWRWVGCTVR